MPKLLLFLSRYFDTHPQPTQSLNYDTHDGSLAFTEYTRDNDLHANTIANLESMPMDLTGQKFPDFSLEGDVYPDKITESVWGRLFPLLDAAQLRQEYLFGIPMWSFFVDPVTKQRQKLTDPILEKIIERMVNRVEEDSGTIIMPSYTTEDYPFDLAEYRSFGFMKLNVRPYTSIVHVQVRAADKSRLFEAPLPWVGVAGLVKGRLSLLPQGTAGAVMASASGTPPFLLYLAQLSFTPQFWQVQGIAGFRDGLIPTMVNDLIGMRTAIEVLSMLGATYAFMTGGSLSIDAMSQSSSGPGPAIFQTRIAQLQQDYAKEIRKYKKFCGLAIVSGTV